MIASLVGLALAAVLGIAGAVAIYNTKDGQVQGSDRPELPFPSTPTGMLAVVGADGELASLAVFAGRPPADGNGEGRGGTVVPVPITADVSGGFGSERFPLNETVSMFGVETLSDEVPALLGVSIDQGAVIGAGALEETLESLGPLVVDLPVDVLDSAGATIATAGRHELDAAGVAELLTVRNPSQRGDERYVVDVAVWRAIAEAVGDGAGGGPELSVSASTEATTTPGDSMIDELIARLTSGPISVQPLQSRPIVSIDVNPRGVDALALDPVEIAVIFGHVAPSRVSAPYPGYNFRIVSGFRDDQLVGGVSRLDVAYTATKALFGRDGNVLSVDTVAAEAGSATLIEVRDESLIPAAQSLGEVFGPVEIRVGDERIAGIDVVVTLGTDYLAMLNTAAGTDTTVAPPGSGAESIDSDSSATSVASTG